MIEPVQKGEIPFVRILIPFILGISIALNYGLSSPQLERYIRILLFGLFFTFGFFLLLYKRLDLYKVKWVGGLLVFLIIFLSGFILLINKNEKRNLIHFSRYKEKFLTGTIVSDPKPSGEVLRFIVKISGGADDNKYQRFSGNLLVTVKLKNPHQIIYQYGDLILIVADYKEIESPYNPSEFNYKEYLSHQSVFHQTFINENQIKILKRHQGNQIMDFAVRLKHKLVSRFNRFIKDKDAAAVASTLILGYRATLSPEILSAYSSTGTMHVLSVSGMHVGIVFLILSILLKKMQRTGVQRFIRALALLLFIWTYALITGFSPAVCRAVLMLSFIILGKAANRRLNTYNLLAVSAVLLLIYNPFFIVDVGFQLSYLAVTGLICFYPRIYHSMFFNNKFADKTWSYLSLSISAQLATFPFSVYYFHQFPVYFLISNLFIILPVAVIMYAGIAFILIPFDIFSRPLGWLLDKSISFTDNVLHYIENLSFSVIKNIWISTSECLLFYVLILLLILFFYFKKRLLMQLSALLVLILTLGNTVRNIRQQKTNKIIFFSLRKGSAIGFIEGKKGVLLTDLAEDDKNFSYSVSPAFESKHIDIIAKKAFGMAFKKSNLFSDGHFLQFMNWKMLICGRNFDHSSVKNKVSLDAVLIRDNSPADLSDLLHTLKFNLLIIDGSNNYNNIYRLQGQARRLSINCYVLKKNPACIINL